MNTDPKIHAGYFDRKAQQRLVDDVREILRAAPLFIPVMPRSGKPFSVRMSNCGRLGWVSDRDGYRYQPQHPLTGRPWPDIPAALIGAWSGLSGYPAPPEACLINFYQGSARMGLHQDRDEETFDAPVLSVSLGDTAVFRIGGRKRSDPTRSLHLSSGDVLVMGGQSRLAFHGVDRIIRGSSALLRDGGRINLTLRRVTPI